MMNKSATNSGLALILLGAVAFAQDITGTWQGMLNNPQANRELRGVLKIAKDGATYKGTFYSIDQGGPGVAAGAITVSGAAMKVQLPGIGGAIEGKFDSDGVNLTGTFTQGA